MNSLQPDWAPRARAIATGLVVFLVAAGLVFRATQTWPFLRVFGLSTALGVGLLAFVVAGFCGWGFVLLDGFLGDDSLEGAQPNKDRHGQKSVDVALSFVAGTILLGVVFSVLAPLLMPTAGLSVGVFSLGVLLLALGRSRGRKNGLHASLARDSHTLRLGSPATTLRVLLVAAFFVPPLLHALVPAVSLDSLVYHLAVPRQYALLGGAVDLPWNVHSWFPRHASMLYGLVLPFESLGRLAQMLHLTAAAMTLILVAGLGRRLFGEEPSALSPYGRLAGLWAVVLLLGVPALNVTAGWAWADWWVLLYVAAGIEFGYRACEQDHTWPAIAAGLCAGAALACKYVALPVLALPALFWPKIRSGRVLIASAVALIPPSPWLLFNFRATGNPLFPLFSGQGEQLGNYRIGDGAFDRWTWWLGRPELIDESVGLVLPVMLLLAFLVRPRASVSVRPILGLAGLYLVAALIYQPTIRSFSVLILVAALFGGGAIARVLVASTWQRRSLLCGVAVLAAFDLSQVLYVLEEYRPIKAVIGLESPSAYLGSGLPYFGPYRQIESRTEETERVLVVGESRIFHLRRPAIAASYLDPHPIRHFRTGCETTACVAAALRAAKVSMIYVDYARLRVGSGDANSRRVIDETSFEVSAEDDLVFKDLLLCHGREVWREGSVVLYELVAAQ